MRRERFLETSLQQAFPSPRIRTHAEAMAELRAPCGRFGSAISMEESLRSFISEKAADLDDVPGSFSLGGGTPLNWQRLLAFLHEAGVTGAPHFKPRYFRNDHPRLLEYFELSPTADTDASDGYPAPYGGFGGSFDTEEAMPKTVGETLERHFLSRYARGTLRKEPYAELSRWNRALDMSQFDFFLPWQKSRFPALSFSAETPLYWVEGKELGSGMQTFLPAQLVYWNYDHAKGGEREPILFSQTTSGSAGHFTRDEAVLSALLEAIERDAFLIYWLNGLTPRVIDADTADDPEIAHFVGAVRGHGFEPVFVNTTSDFGIPTATCVMTDRSLESPVLGIGSSAGFTLKETLLASAIEAFSVLHFTSLREPFDIPAGYEPFVRGDIGRTERLSAWRGETMAKRMAFFTAGARQDAQEFIRPAASFDTPQKQLAFVTRTCAARGAGYEIYVFEAESPILSRLGYHVVRTIVPQLTPLYLIESLAPLNARRLREVPEKIGYKPAEKFTPWPHPFP